MGCARSGRASRAKQSMHYCAYLGHAREGGGGHDRPASRPKHRPSKAWAGMARQPMSRVVLGPGQIDQASDWSILHDPLGQRYMIITM
jgi:hypothetical protein